MGPADPENDFDKNGARVVGNKVSTGEGFLPVGLPGKGDKVANLVDSSSKGKKGGEAPVITRKRRVELQPRSRGFGAGLPAPQTDRHHMAGR